MTIASDAMPKKGCRGATKKAWKAILADGGIAVIYESASPTLFHWARRTAI
jgi:hypothetical protein